MAADENEQEHILALASGELMLLWQLFRPDVGQAVEITSGAPRIRSLCCRPSSCRCLSCVLLPDTMTPLLGTRPACKYLSSTQMAHCTPMHT